MKSILYPYYTCFLLLVASLFLSSCNEETTQKVKHFTDLGIPKGQVFEVSAAKRKELLHFLSKNKQYNKEYVWLFDVGRHSGKYRFGLYDVARDSFLHKGLVTHGSGSLTDEPGQLKFSNVPNSNATSLGKYRIGKKYSGQFGLAYKLHGLDQTNSKAYERFVVLHSHSCVPEEETLSNICLSLGCPTLAPKFYTLVMQWIDRSKKPMLLDIYRDM